MTHKVRPFQIGLCAPMATGQISNAATSVSTAHLIGTKAPPVLSALASAAVASAAGFWRLDRISAAAFYQSFGHYPLATRRRGESCRACGISDARRRPRWAHHGGRKRRRLRTSRQLEVRAGFCRTPRSPSRANWSPDSDNTAPSVSTTRK